MVLSVCKVSIPTRVVTDWDTVLPTARTAMDYVGLKMCLEKKLR